MLEPEDEKRFNDFVNQQVIILDKVTIQIRDAAIQYHNENCDERSKECEAIFLTVFMEYFNLVFQEHQEVLDKLATVLKGRVN